MEGGYGYHPPRGWEVLKAKILKGMYWAKLEFPDRWGDSNQKTFQGRGMDILWNNTLDHGHLFEEIQYLKSEFYYLSKHRGFSVLLLGKRYIYFSARAINK